MTSYVSLNKQAHQNQGVSGSISLTFALKKPLVPVLCDEVQALIGQMPLAFQKTIVNDNEVTSLVGVQSLTPNKNLFILPDGRWIKGYRPAFYRAYPFALMPGKESGQLVLSVIEEEIKSELLDSDKAFYNENGELSDHMQNVVKFLGETIKSRQKTLIACKTLDDLGVVKPWPIEFTVQGENDQPQKQKLEGLYRVDTEALKELSGDQLAQLTQTDALKIAYAQHFSELRLQTLAQLQTAYKKVDEHFANKDKPLEEPDLESLFDSGDDLLSF